MLAAATVWASRPMTGACQTAARPVFFLIQSPAHYRWPTRGRGTVSDHSGGDAAGFERGAAIGERDMLNQVDGRAASLVLERQEKRFQAIAAFL